MTYKKPQPWSPEEDAMIIAKELSDAEIAELSGRSLVAVRVRRTKIPQRRCNGNASEVKPRGWCPTPEEIEERAAMVRRNWEIEA